MKKSVFILIGMLIGHLAFAGAPATPPKLGDTVISEQSYSTSSSAGTSKEVSRKDHKHGNPPLPTSIQIISQMGYTPMSGLSVSSTINEVNFACGAGSSPTCTVSRTAPVPVSSGGTGTTCQQFYIPVNCASHIASVVTGTTAETTLSSCNIPANSMGVLGALYTDVTWSYTNSGNNKSRRGYFGGQQFWLRNGTTTRSAWQPFAIFNRNSMSDQVVSAGSGLPNAYSETTAAIGTLSVDTTQDQTLTWTCQLTVAGVAAGESCSIESATYWIIRPVCP